MNISKGGNKLVENQNGKNQTYYMQLDILQKLEQHKKETGAAKSTVINMAVKEYLDKRRVDNK